LLRADDRSLATGPEEGHSAQAPVAPPQPSRDDDLGRRL
jgi:hypothetical protein